MFLTKIKDLYFIIFAYNVKILLIQELIEVA
jgi:hypothetical protein